jgi:cytochrome c peroxidase
MDMMKILTVGILLGCLATPVCHALEVLPDAPPNPKDNPMTPDKVQLGKQLFFDKRLSLDKTVSCNSCHGVNEGGVDHKTVSDGVGGKKGGRNAPTVLNSAFQSVQFWDGRAASLEEQAKGPMVNPVEMAMPDHKTIVERLEKIPGYKEQFTKIFGPGAITIDQVAMAIASYERTLITPDSPYDRYMKGNKSAMNKTAVRGMELIQKVGCTTCHFGPNFSGPQMPAGTGFYQRFPNIPGSEYDSKYNLTLDQGRYEVTKKETDRHMYRVPTWRNIALTAPYFHNGSVKTLDEAVRVMAKTQLGKTLTEAEVKDIVAFLKSLTGKLPHQSEPALPN